MFTLTRAQAEALLQGKSVRSGDSRNTSRVQIRIPPHYPIMIIPYDASLVPPVPFLSAHVSNLTDSAESPLLPAKVDTGADVTAIPANLVNRLNLAPASEIQVEGDMLNLLRLLLDGPALSLEVLSPQSPS